MFLLLLGLCLWVAGHMWHRAVPDIYDRLGNGGRGISTIIILGSVVVMVIGYRGAAFIPVWYPPAFLTHVNNLLMLAALFTFFTSATRTGVAWVTGNLRHPQLTGFKIWAVAHLLVNGNVASLLLFGGLLVWAVIEVIVINRQIRAEGAGVSGDIPRDAAPITSPSVHVLLVAVVFVVIAGVHSWLGVSPFGG